MNRFPHLAQRLFNVPIAIHPQKAEIIVAAVADRLGIAHIFRAGGLPPALPAAFDEDGCGGEVSGLFDLADMIYGMSARQGGDKPIWAILDDRAYSAAYAIASAADRITVPRAGGVASIGTIVIHSEVTEALKKDGIAVTIIRSDDLKAEGNPYEALSADARDRIQAEIDDLNDLFIRTVARNRGLDEKAVRATRAGVFTGPTALDRAVALGFADEVASPDAAFTALLRSL
jgi:ClpP class serine protease